MYEADKKVAVIANRQAVRVLHLSGWSLALLALAQNSNPTFRAFEVSASELIDESVICKIESTLSTSKIALP